MRQQFSIGFATNPIGGTLKTSRESHEVIWLDPARLDELDIHPSMRLRIDHCLAGGAEPYVG